MTQLRKGVIPIVFRAYPNNGSLSLVMLSSGLLTENAMKHLGCERRYQAQILRLRLRMTNAKDQIEYVLNMCAYSDGILQSGICCGKQKPTMSPLQKQGFGAKKLGFRFRRNDSVAQELIPIGVREYYE